MPVIREPDTLAHAGFDPEYLADLTSVVETEDQWRGIYMLTAQIMVGNALVRKPPRHLLVLARGAADLRDAIERIAAWIEEERRAS